MISSIRASRTPATFPVGAADGAIRPFRLHVPQIEVDELRRRVAARRSLLSPRPHGGSRLAADPIEELAEYWCRWYEWRTHEAALRTVPQFTTHILRQRFHFMHVRSPEPQALPLVLAHGWPGSIAEFTRIIGPLSHPRAHGGDANDAFHVVVPSLPGFGFSVPFSEPGWGNPFRVAGAIAELMQRLGYERFGVHGSSVGALVAATSGVLSPERVIGVHLAAPAPFPYGREIDLDRQAADASHAGSLLTRFLADSPTALLTWTMEHLAGADESGVDELERMDRDQLLTNASLYWYTSTAATSAEFVLGATRAYATFVATSPERARSVMRLETSMDAHPAARASVLPPWAELDAGRTPAMTTPDLLVAELRAFFRAQRQAWTSVSG